MKHAKGFTLIEILMVIALIGILASIAIPAYNNYVIRGKLVDASTQLASARINLEQFFQDNRTYAGGTCPSATKYFTFSCATTPTTYLVTATSNVNQGLGMNAGDYTYTIDYNNAKTTTKFAGTTTTSTCWIMKQGDTC
jgi:type IV pilus assembly protein PilE